MFLYGKTAANAIAILSYLAATAGRRVGPQEIADARGLSKALTAKLLTLLSAAKLVRGVPGPGGGYQLTRPATDINLLEIVSVFERTESSTDCPFGRVWCKRDRVCPLHDDIHQALQSNRGLLERITLDVFVPRTDHQPPSEENSSPSASFSLYS